MPRVYLPLLYVNYQINDAPGSVVLKISESPAFEVEDKTALPSPA